MIKWHTVFEIRWEKHIINEKKSQIDSKETAAYRSFNLLNQTCRLITQLM